MRMTPVHPPGRVETLNGVHLYFEVHGTGEPLLLLHGFSGSSQDWVPSLAQWGTKFQFILPDLRGHGRSSILSPPLRPHHAPTPPLPPPPPPPTPPPPAVGIRGGG